MKQPLSAAGNNGSALFLTDIDIAENLLQLTLINESADLHAFFPRTAHLHSLEFLLQGSDELVIDRVLNEDAGAGAADLALIEEDAHLSTFERLIKVAVVEDDVRGLAAEFERRRDDALRSGKTHIAAHFGGTGEGELREARMLKDPGQPRGRNPGERSRRRPEGCPSGASRVQEWRAACQKPA